ncbi:FkbM family methyltransferase [Flavobacterium saccharophilum]|uniref:Methyltransferase, FkbM family n=1 Tax=Flavobacterium saccharophilum TaxID=29534 RepID=A0A1M7K7H7_9FLAO|nr:FkbM family methyltransferase [Flavobacterium saccharophilum]SHM61135.1 methyltransferase, FkbM family [Flavobacterium saccharophilum]
MTHTNFTGRQELYFSQYKQDQFLDKVLFNKKKNGFFIDVGAHDGVTISNSIFFEKYRSWKGICIEPNPIIYDKLVKNRSSVNLNVCIGNSNETVKFTQVVGYSEMLSGVTSKYDEHHLDRINDEISQNGGEIKSIEVQMIRLEYINEIEEKKIDFISIDTEGNEFDIIKSIDFEKISVKVLVIENNYKNVDLFNFLINNNFILIATLHTDEVYINKKALSFNVKLNLFVWNSKRITNRYWKRIKMKLKKILHG